MQVRNETHLTFFKTIRCGDNRGSYPRLPMGKSLGLGFDHFDICGHIAIN